MERQGRLLLRDIERTTALSVYVFRNDIVLSLCVFYKDIKVCRCVYVLFVAHSEVACEDTQYLSFLTFTNSVI